MANAQAGFKILDISAEEIETEFSGTARGLEGMEKIMQTRVDENTLQQIARTLKDYGLAE